MAWFWIWFNSCSRSSVVATARVCLPRVARYRFDVATLVSRNLYRPQNTRVHLQGAPQRLALSNERPHLRALSGATRCSTALSTLLAPLPSPTDCHRVASCFAPRRAFNHRSSQVLQRGEIARFKKPLELGKTPTLR